MRKQTRSDAVAHLSGFLYAISAFSGDLRSYTSSSFCIVIREESQTIAGLINEYFRGQYKFSFGDTEKPLSGLGELEVRVAQYLIRDETSIIADRITELQGYLSFRIIDMIHDIFGTFGKKHDLRVIELREENLASLEDSVFFCIRSRDLLLVLQFDDNRGRR